MWSIRGTRGSWNCGSITKLFFSLFFCLSFTIVAGALEKAIYTSEYGLSIFPAYRPVIGQTVTLRVKTFKPAQKVTLYSDREEQVPMTFQNGYWWGKYHVPTDYQPGSHFFTVWIRYPYSEEKSSGGGWWNIFPPKKRSSSFWSKSEVWYGVGSAGDESELDAESGDPDAFIAGVENFEEVSSEEAVGFPVLASAEGEVMVPGIRQNDGGLLIKGSQSITFKSHSIEGSKEGETPGTSQAREETLRVSLSGNSDGTEIEGSLYRTSAAGVATIAQDEDKVTLRLKRGQTEAYLGDFTADLNETEFARLNKVLSGVKARGDYDNFGFTALYSSPKGEGRYTRLYGNGTQGPYALGSAPVVIDSERVTVDGRPQKRGDDYNIDYQAGTITFIKKVIDPLSILQVHYDYRQTLYQHATYGLRSYYRLTPGLKVGLTYLNDSDLLTNAAAIRQSQSQEAIDPQGHWLAGVDAAYVSENFSAYSEAAYSLKNWNLLALSGSEEAGKAARFGINGAIGPLTLAVDWKRTGANFRPIAEPDPKLAITAYSGTIGFRPSYLFGLSAGQNYEQYIQDGVGYKNDRRNARAQLTPDNWPSLEYFYLENDESNDPVSGALIERSIRRDSVETIYQRGFIAASLKGSVEKWLVRSPSEEATDYQRANFGLATVGLDKFSLAGNVELEERRLPDGTQPYRHTYNLNLSTTPVKEFFASASFQLLDDTQQGNTNVTELTYKAEPFSFFKTDGKYSINSLLQDFPATAETVSKQSGSFNFELRPLRALRLRYLFKPNFTQVVRTGTLSYNNEQQQMEANFAPLKELMLGWLNKLGRGYTVYNGDYPNYQIKQNSQDTDSTLYSVKLAPFQPISIEFDYLLDNLKSATLASTAEPYSYVPGTGNNRQFDTIIKTSLTERFAVDSRYTYRTTLQGSGEAAAKVVDSVSHAGSLKGLWNITENWTTYLSGSFTKSTDRLLSLATYTYSPGFGLSYRRGDAFRSDLDCSYSQSWAGATTEKANLSLKVRYALSEFVIATLQFFREESRRPDYRQTDLTGNVEINL